MEGDAEPGEGMEEGGGQEQELATPSCDRKQGPIARGLEQGQAAPFHGRKQGPIFRLGPEVAPGRFSPFSASVGTCLRERLCFLSGGRFIQ